MREIATYFDLPSIVSTLAAIRARTALKRHEITVYSHLFKNAPNPVDVVKPKADAYLPPRRQWKRGTKDDRKPRTSDAVNAHAIRRTVLGILKNNQLAEYEWGRRLCDIFECLQSILKSGSVTLSSPEVRLLPKPCLKKQEKPLYRVLATYENPIDWLLLGQTGKYLRDALDELFCEGSYAFRKSSRFSHNTAVENLLEYRKRFEGRPLYVAECDISKFFDTVNHNVVRESFGRIVSLTRNDKTRGIDPFAMRVVEAYLTSYSFSDSVLGSTDDVVREKLKNGEVDLVAPEMLTAFYSDMEVERLGIPQGGSLSPFLANCVLDEADRSVLVGSDLDLFYARFCDDMILIHPDQKKCKAALERYLQTMQRLKLPVHEVEKKIKYGPEYYACKSKGPFKWAAATPSRKTMPWISFVGYQIRFDGQLRLRRQTIRNHHERQVKEISKVVKCWRREGECHKKSFLQIYFTIRSRLIAVGVGKLSLRARHPETPQLCWLDAFPLLNKRAPSQYVVRQMRELDKNRNRQLWHLRKILEKDDEGGYETAKTGNRMPAPPMSKGISISPSVTLTGVDVKETQPDVEKRRDPTERRFFFGKPFSYVGFLTRIRNIEFRFTKRVSSSDAYRA